MKFRLKSTLIIFAVLIAFGGINTQEAAAQGPLIKRLRSLNRGKPILPFVNESQPTKATGSRAPTPAKTPPKDLKKGSGSRAPTPAKKSDLAGKKPKAAEPLTSKAKYPTVKLTSGESAKTDQRLTAKGFGMKVKQSGEKFYVGEIGSRGNAAAAGLRRGDQIVNVGGAPLKVVEEIESIAKAMKGGDRVEFEVARRGSKPEKVFVQYGQAPPVKQPVNKEPSRVEIAPASRTPTVREPARYEPEPGSGLRSVYEGGEIPSSVFEPTPAPRGSNRVESLDLPALELDN